MFRLSLTLACVCLTAAADLNADLDSLLTPETIAKLDKGQTVIYKKGAKDEQGGSRGFGRVLAVIDRPKDEVWQALVNDEDRPAYAPHLVSVERYYEKENEVGIKETVRLLLRTYRYHCIQTRDKEAGSIVWRLDTTKENSIKDTTGSWFIRPYRDTKTVVMYTISVDSGLFFPKVAENILFNHDLPNIVESLKKYLESKPVQERVP